MHQLINEVTVLDENHMQLIAHFDVRAQVTSGDIRIFRLAVRFYMRQTLHDHGQQQKRAMANMKTRCTHVNHVSSF